MITPTIGRVVWYHPDRPDAATSQPWAALVVYVHSDTMVNLVVFDEHGMSKPKTSTHLWQGEGSPPGGSYCEWMPYQKGQAAKYEALEASKSGGLQQAQPSRNQP